MSKVSLFYVLIVLLISCKGGSDEGRSSVFGCDEELLNGCGIQVDSFYMIPLECTDKSLIAEIRKIDFIDSLIIVQTSNQVLAFNRLGRFLHAYGSRGNGEAEYVSLSTMAIDKIQKRVSLIDNYVNRILSFTVDGKFISARKFEGTSLSLVQNCEYLDSDNLFCSNFLYNNSKSVYSIFNISSGEKRELYQFPAETNNTAEYIGHHPFSLWQDTLRCVVPFDNNLFVLSNDKLKRCLEIRTNKQLVNQREIENIEDFSIITYSTFMAEDKYIGFSDLFETQNYIMASFSNVNYVLINKNTHQGKLYSYSLPLEITAELPLYNIVATDGDYFVGIGMPYAMKEWRFAFANRSKASDEMQRIISLMSDDDNPCLLFYKIVMN